MSFFVNDGIRCKCYVEFNDVNISAAFICSFDKVGWF
jgi:hypothetical protein